MTSPLDAAAYVRPPRVGVASGLSLAKMLLGRIPPAPSNGVLMAANALAAAVTTTEDAWQSQGQQAQPPNARPADIRLDRAFGAVHARLSSYEVLPAEDPDRIRSGELLDRLLPEGLGFLKLTWPKQHAHSERIVTIVAEEGLRADLDRLVGEAFTTELWDAHQAYGVALGITTATPDPAPKISLVEPLRAMTQAIADYALQVLAFAKLHPDHLAPAKRALAPIDAFRRAAARRSSTEPITPSDELPEGAPPPDAPMPALPAA